MQNTLPPHGENTFQKTVTSEKNTPHAERTQALPTCPNLDLVNVYPNWVARQTGLPDITANTWLADKVAFTLSSASQCFRLEEHTNAYPRGSPPGTDPDGLVGKGGYHCLITSHFTVPDPNWLGLSEKRSRKRESERDILFLLTVWHRFNLCLFLPLTELDWRDVAENGRVFGVSVSAGSSPRFLLPPSPIPASVGASP